TVSDGRRVVQAFWLDSTGTPISEFTDATSSPVHLNTIPSNASAIRVTTRIEYDTFMLGILGQKRLTAEASSVARETVVATVPPPPYQPFSMLPLSRHGQRQPNLRYTTTLRPWVMSPFRTLTRLNCI